MLVPTDKKETTFLYLQDSLYNLCFRRIYFLQVAFKLMLIARYHRRTFFKIMSVLNSVNIPHNRNEFELLYQYWIPKLQETAQQYIYIYRV